MKESERSEIEKCDQWWIGEKEMKMQNDKLLDFTKDLNAQLYALCGLTAYEVKFIEKTIIDMDASRSRRKAQDVSEE